LGLALVLGTAGLPHILMRFYTVPSAKEARRTVVWAIWLIGVFYLFSLVIGYAAAAMVDGGPARIASMPGGENSAAPLLAYQLGGEIFLGFISAVAFATILAVVAGLTITASASFAHDVYANVIKRGNLDADSEVRVARITACVIGALAVLGGIAALGQNVAFLVALAFAVAASANLPTILYSLFWKRFNTTDSLVPGGVRHPEVDVPPCRFRDLPAEEPGAGLGAVGLPARLCRHGAQPERQRGRGPLRRDGSARADRCRGRAFLVPGGFPANSAAAAAASPAGAQTGAGVS
jgi:Na+/proline symporter